MAEPARPRRWVVGGLVVYALAVAIVLLTPVSYAGVVAVLDDGIRRGLGWDGFGSGWIEFVANIALFLPLGLLLTLLLPRRGYGVALALGVSLAAELAQFVIPSRQPSIRDVVANVTGAALGAAIAWLLIRRRPGNPRGDGAAGEN